MKKKIIFETASQQAEVFFDIPKPSSNSIPQWFKDQKVFSNGQSDFIKALKNNSVNTYKACIPVTDCFTSGYMLTLPVDVYVVNAGGNDEPYSPIIRWNVSWNPIDDQPNEVLGNYPTPFNHSPNMFRLNLDWKITTPKGYSSMIMHPLHRFDLPFTTLPGIIDTDAHPSNILLPFFIKTGFEGIIKEGTPMAQVFPFKRESWESERKEIDPNRFFINRNSNNLKVFRSYKTKFWSKKEYT